jgi:hypothetical protein
MKIKSINGIRFALDNSGVVRRESPPGKWEIQEYWLAPEVILAFGFTHKTVEVFPGNSCHTVWETKP